jgi:hypothetical protein
VPLASNILMVLLLYKGFARCCYRFGVFHTRILVLECGALADVGFLEAVESKDEASGLALDQAGLLSPDSPRGMPTGIDSSVQVAW